MPYALVLNTASKSNTTGGSFADSLSANTGDSLSVSNYLTGGARIPYAWAIDSDSVMEGELLFTRYESVHDSQHGKRWQCPALALGGAATNAAFTVLQPPEEIPVFSGDTATINVTTTAADDVVFSWFYEYDDLPGVKATFDTWQNVNAHRATEIGLYNAPVASSTPGAYGTARAINADDTRATANKYYAILGCTVQTQVTTISLTATSWGGQRIGLPVGSLDLDTTMWFVKVSLERGKPFIPVVNANDFSNVLVQVADAEASTSPKVDWCMYEMDSTYTPPSL